MLKNFIFKHGRWAKKKVPYQSLTIDGETWKGRRNTASRWKAMQLPEDMSGMNLLDIGCQIGAFCLEAKRRNANIVVGIDSNKSYLECARKVAANENIDPQYFQADFNTNEVLAILDKFPCTFDYVLFLSVIHYIKDACFVSFMEHLKFKTLVLEGHTKKFNNPKDLPAYMKKNKVEGSIEHIGFSSDQGKRPLWLIKNS